jgi:hypothetical protein
MNPILEQALKTVIPGHKGRVIGSREDMIERTLRRYVPKVTTKTVWDPNRMTYVTKHYMPDGTLMTLKNKISK